jgi:hypothetical protein
MVIHIYFSARHAELRSKNKDCLARIQDNVYEWSDQSIHELLFACHDENKLHFDKMMIKMSALY